MEENLVVKEFRKFLESNVNLLIVKPVLSLTVTANEADPAPEGIPLTTPDADKVKPVGSEPLVRLHEYGGTPPVTPRTLFKSAEYSCPAVAFGSVFILFKVSAGAVQLTVNVCAVPAELPREVGTVKLMSVAD